MFGMVSTQHNIAFALITMLLAVIQSCGVRTWNSKDENLDRLYRARIGLLFERLPEQLAIPSKITDTQLATEHPNYRSVINSLSEMYVENQGKDVSDRVELVDRLRALLPPSEERDKYQKCFMGTRAKSIKDSNKQVFESVSVFPVILEKGKEPKLVVKQNGESKTGEIEVEVARGTIEIDDVMKAWSSSCSNIPDLYRNYAAVRELSEEFALDDIARNVDYCAARVFAHAQSTNPVDVPEISEEAIRALVNYTNHVLGAPENPLILPRTKAEHRNALQELQKLVGKKGGIIKGTEIQWTEDGTYPGLLDQLAKWFDQKDVHMYIVPLNKVPPSLAKALEGSRLKAITITGHINFHITKGLSKGLEQHAKSHPGEGTFESMFVAQLNNFLKNPGAELVPVIF